jgi:hypothetical protein
MVRQHLCRPMWTPSKACRHRGAAHRFARHWSAATVWPRARFAEGGNHEATSGAGADPGLRKSSCRESHRQQRHLSPGMQCLRMGGLRSSCGRMRRAQWARPHSLRRCCGAGLRQVRHLISITLAERRPRCEFPITNLRSLVAHPTASYLHSWDAHKGCHRRAAIPWPASTR